MLERLVMFGKLDVQATIDQRHAHRITKRFMRRLWAQVFAQCAVIEWEGEWRVRWGERELYGLGGRESEIGKDDGGLEVVSE